MTKHPLATIENNRIINIFSLKNLFEDKLYLFFLYCTHYNGYACTYN